MVDHTSLPEHSYGPFDGRDPGLAGLGDCENLFTHLKTKEMIAEKYLARHFLRTQQALEAGEVDNAHRGRGTENPADGLSKVRGDMAPLSRLLESGHFNPGSLKPLRRVPWKE